MCFGGDFCEGVLVAPSYVAFYVAGESYPVSACGIWGMWIGSLGGERGDVGLLGTYDVSESEAVGSSESYDDVIGGLSVSRFGAVVGVSAYSFLSFSGVLSGRLRELVNRLPRCDDGIRRGPCFLFWASSRCSCLGLSFGIGSS
ncbi:hypothetical protein F2Q70_00022158 [Brassica cretica]|uniref:Uncharacterized protein n=1 Tax=Brassica cretica TaxID=69181 RepID=A0A8S9GVT1_BRACR|nr:hypothetical protein F2Q70_00022158 [Brassica cretica]